MFRTLGCLILILIFLQFCNSTLNTRCFPRSDGTSVCFLQPDASQALSWSDAHQWCKNNGATLPITSISSLRAIYSNAVGYFGLGDQTLWLGGNSTLDFNTWKWIDGSAFNGEIEDRDNSGRTHAVVEKIENTAKIKATSPFDRNYGLLRYEWIRDEIACATERNSLWTNGICYTKDKGSNTWYFLRSWINMQIAIVEDVSQISMWLENATKYWIGLRCTWWNWQDSVSGTSYEFTETAFGWNLPNNTSPECLASRADDGTAWINRDCSAKLRFICQLPVNVTTTTKTSTTTTTTSTTPSTTTLATTTSSTTTSTSPKSTTSTPTATSTTPTSTTTTPWSSITSTTSMVPASSFSTLPYPEKVSMDVNSQKFDTGSAVGLGFGLGLVFFLILVIWLIALTVLLAKLIRASRRFAMDLDRRTAEESKYESRTYADRETEPASYTNLSSTKMGERNNSRNSNSQNEDNYEMYDRSRGTIYANI